VKELKKNSPLREQGVETEDRLLEVSGTDVTRMALKEVMSTIVRRARETDAANEPRVFIFCRAEYEVTIQAHTTAKLGIVFADIEAGQKKGVKVKELKEHSPLREQGVETEDRLLEVSGTDVTRMALKKVMSTIVRRARETDAANEPRVFIFCRAADKKDDEHGAGRSDQARMEAEEKARKEAEEKARKEAEEKEKERKEAEEKARQEDEGEEDEGEDVKVGDSLLEVNGVDVTRKRLETVLEEEDEEGGDFKEAGTENDNKGAAAAPVAEPREPVGQSKLNFTFNNRYPGMRIGVANNQVVVLKISEGGEAKARGMKVDDIVLEINEQSFRPFQMSQLQTLRNALTKRPLHLKLLRQGGGVAS
jgi:C-terminal processing protease CtpA/Prc